MHKSGTKDAREEIEAYRYNTISYSEVIFWREIVIKVTLKLQSNKQKYISKQTEIYIKNKPLMEIES